MTTIHAVPKKHWHFPTTTRHSLYRKGQGWLVKPEDSNPDLEITDDTEGTNIDICIPNVTEDKVGILGYKGFVKKAVKAVTQTDMIHIVLPPEGKKGVQ